MKRTLIFILLIGFASCSGDDDVEKIKPAVENEIGEISGVETLFDSDTFEDAKHKELLKELKICSEFQKDTTNYMEPACSPRFFRILPMSEKVPVENAFLLQIKSKVGGIKLRRTVAFVRERGELVKANTFVANLIGFRKTGTKYNDLILRFNDNVEGEIIFYNCLFVWNGKKYQFKSVELIEGATWRQHLKPEFKDSVSTDIYNVLIKNEMIL